MAKLKAVVDSLDSVPDGLRELYVEGSDGKFRLDADGVEDVSGLKSALAKEKREKEQLRAKIPDGFEPERWNALLALEEEAAKGQLTDKQREAAEAWKKGVLEGHQKELGKREDTIKGLRAALEKELIEARAATALAEHRGSVDLLMPVIERNVKVVEQDGKFVAAVYADGNPRVNKDGGLLTVGEYVAELKANEKYAPAFDGSGSSGSGAHRSAGGAGGQKTVAAGDPRAFFQNLKGIADGTVKMPA